MDTVFWWIGAAMVGVIGVAGAAACIAGLYALAAVYFTMKLRSMGVATRNLSDVGDWVNNGRPQWRWHGSCAAMEPSEPGFERRTAYEARLETELQRRRTRRWFRLLSLSLNVMLIAYVAWSAWA